MTVEYPSAKELMDRASEQTGLDDFGEPTFLEGLDVMRESLAADVPYGPADREKAINLIVRRLANRLQIEAWFAAHPGAENAPIENPISIVGLPRTGTTALGNMLSLEPQFRSLRAWEQEQPCPPPRLEDEERDPRRVAYVTMVENLLRDDPEQAAMHLWDADASVEDTEVLGLEFRSQQMTMPIWRYHDWWRKGDMRPTFAYHARVARLLQSSRPPNRWLFKAPHHKFHLDHMVDAYPDIRFVFTHRDPVKSVPSYASFVASLYPPEVVAKIGKEKIGREIHSHLLTGMHQAMAAREKLGPDRFLDVHHADFVARPMEELERIYDWLGMELTNAMRQRFETWREENHSGAHGAHRYTAEEYGMSPEQLREDFDFYIRALDIPSRRLGAHA
ncbi:sulfotransferase [Croceicoccus estronivorus]|uniref:sulfotransferase family protein n=1 Tax=Croceicoccus estronivorus TaxID=1172626 RepID=UPI00082B7BA8|nr:sulfotransferase [Croceicoccus estronivorus]OCC23604.1 sulfotransferase [Croceicoccus estronivorus]